MEKDYHKILGVSQNATEEEIKKAYHALSRKYHPDMNINQTEEEKVYAEEKFKEIGEAYAILSNPEEQKKHVQKRTQSTTDVNEFNEAMQKFNNKFNSFNEDFYFDFSFKKVDPTFKMKEKIKNMDFSEIIALENKITEQKEILKNIDKEIFDYGVKIKQEEKKIKAEIEEIRKKKTSEEGYLKALQYIEKFRKRDRLPVINLTTTEKQVNLYHQCVDIISIVEKQLEALRKSMEEERITPLKEAQKKKEEEYWNLYREQSKLRRTYSYHPLKYEYEEFKNMEEKSRSK